MLPSLRLARVHSTPHILKTQTLALHTTAISRRETKNETETAQQQESDERSSQMQNAPAQDIADAASHGKHKQLIPDRGLTNRREDKAMKTTRGLAKPKSVRSGDDISTLQAARIRKPDKSRSIETFGRVGMRLRPPTDHEELLATNFADTNQSVKMDSYKTASRESLKSKRSEPEHVKKSRSIKTGDTSHVFQVVSYFKWIGDEPRPGPTSSSQDRLRKVLVKLRRFYLPYDFGVDYSDERIDLAFSTYSQASWAAADLKGKSIQGFEVKSVELKKSGKTEGEKKCPDDERDATNRVASSKTSHDLSRILEKGGHKPEGKT